MRVCCPWPPNPRGIGRATEVGVPPDRAIGPIHLEVFFRMTARWMVWTSCGFGLPLSRGAAPNCPSSTVQKAPLAAEHPCCKEDPSRTPPKKLKKRRRRRWLRRGDQKKPIRSPKTTPEEQGASIDFPRSSERSFSLSTRRSLPLKIGSRPASRRPHDEVIKAAPVACETMLGCSKMPSSACGRIWVLAGIQLT